ncbi:rhodanese-like domain-containing protein [Silanimonas sp.]|uniref:sulfurtransferase n=1 Tax=Silanimonas sp. TaxID=1929290 RepID=UPI00262959A9|nr:rhodanese-like domain-containing protein [Silanimonas sp.]
MPNPEACRTPAARDRAYALAFAGCVLALAVAVDAAAAPSRFVDVETARVLVEENAATVLDTRGLIAFARGHIDGAARFDWYDTREGAATGGRLPTDLDALARRFAEAGVDDARPVLVCGDGGQRWGEEARVAWTLDVLGKNKVHLLDGGCAAWREAGHAWSVGPDFAARSGGFTARPQFHARATKADVRRALADPNITLIDVRARDEFDGATPYGEARGGHLPRAVHLDWRTLSDADGSVLRGEALRSRMNEAGVPGGQPAIVYCTGGVRSAFVTELLREHGIDARNYDGSMWEWAADAALPLE